MIKQATKKLMELKSLSHNEAALVMDEIMNGNTSDIQTAAFLVALALKGETIEEISGCAASMRCHAVPILCNDDLFEIVGTGGDGSNSFNISTAASIVIASAGVKVAKHGNRSASSQCGSADCLEELGVKINLSPEKCLHMLEKLDICFLFAQNFHSSMRYVAPVRKELGVRTIFNILGPLTNPASANRQILGVYSEKLVEPLAHVLFRLGVKRGMVVYGQDQLDEISLSAPTTVCEFNNGRFQKYVIKPSDFGLQYCNKKELVGGTPKENAQIVFDIFNGKKGPKYEAVVLNAGAGLYIAEKVDCIEKGVEMAKELIYSGKTKSKMEEFIRESNIEEEVS